MSEVEDLRRELEFARSIIARQSEEINRLERSEERITAVDVLREVMELGDIAGTALGQGRYQALLEGIIAAAQHLFNARAASIMLLDGASGELVFEASTDREAGGILGMRFPANQGIAGWVVMTGEPLAVGDVRQDPHFARDVAQSTGYLPDSILAVPLIVHDGVEGVLEVLDKRGGTSFDLDDIALLSLFARPAALAVEQARLVSGIGKLLLQELANLAGTRGNVALQEAVHIAVERESPLAGETLELARLLQNLTRQGKAEQQLATDLLRSIARYTGSRT